MGNARSCALLFQIDELGEAMDYLIRTLVIGVGATAFMDLVALVRLRLYGAPSADYAMVGRWLAYLTRGRFRHEPIAASPPVRGERVIGWLAHYLIGIGSRRCCFPSGDSIGPAGQRCPLR